MEFSRFWLNMADKEIKVHSLVIRIFPVIQRAKNDRSVQRKLPVYENVAILVNTKYGFINVVTDGKIIDDYICRDQPGKTGPKLGPPSSSLRFLSFGLVQ